MVPGRATKEHDKTSKQPTGATTVGGAPQPEPQAVATVNEVQSIQINGAVSGNFAVAFIGAPSGNIPASPSAAQVLAALNQCSTIAAGDIAVAGTNPFSVTFQNGLGGQDVPQLTLYSENLNPPSATVVIQTTTQGSDGTTGNPTQDAINAAYQVLAVIHRHGPTNWPDWENKVVHALNLLAPLQTTVGGIY